MIDGLGATGHRVGEVVESASDRFIAQCYRLYQSPPLGALVQTGRPSWESFEPNGLNGIDAPDAPSRTYAVVYGVSTQALDPGRPVVARGENEEREEGVYSSNPQLARLLSTRFEAIIVGHGDGDSVSQFLPSLPPAIHAFVYVCKPQEVARFSRSLHYLSLLVHSSPAGRGVTDEVIAACLRQASVHAEDSRAFLVSAGKVLAGQLSGELPRLNALLRRLAP